MLNGTIFQSFARQLFLTLYFVPKSPLSEYIVEHMETTEDLNKKISELWIEIDYFELKFRRATTQSEKSELTYVLLDKHLAMRELYNIKKAEDKMRSKS